MDSLESGEAVTIGKYLKARREGAGLTVEQVSGITRIRGEYIELIEKEDFSSFTSQHLLKGYIKLIAKTVMADEKEALRLLESVIKNNFKDKNVDDIVGNRFKEEKEKTDRFRKRIAVIVAAALAVILLSYATVKLFRFVKSINVEKYFSFSGGKTPAQVSPKTPAPVTGAGNNEAGQPQAPAANTLKYPVVLKGAVIEKTWVAVRIDGGSSVTSMLYPGDKEEWDADKSLKIKIGNGAGIDLEYNGKNIGKPGAEKQVVTLRFPPEAVGVNNAPAASPVSPLPAINEKAVSGSGQGTAQAEGSVNGNTGNTAQKAKK